MRNGGTWIDDFWRKGKKNMNDNLWWNFLLLSSKIVQFFHSFFVSLAFLNSFILTSFLYVYLYLFLVLSFSLSLFIYQSVLSILYMAIRVYLSVSLCKYLCECMRVYMCVCVLSFYTSLYFDRVLFYCLFKLALAIIWSISLLPLNPPKQRFFLSRLTFCYFFISRRQSGLLLLWHLGLV